MDMEKIATLAGTFEEARSVIAEANNSLYGSQGYFLSKNGGPPDKYHLARPIEELKHISNQRWQEVQRLRSALERIARGDRAHISEREWGSMLEDEQAIAAHALKSQ